MDWNPRIWRDISESDFFFFPKRSIMVYFYRPFYAYPIYSRGSPSLMDRAGSSIPLIFNEASYKR